MATQSDIKSQRVLLATPLATHKARKGKAKP